MQTWEQPNKTGCAQTPCLKWIPVNLWCCCRSLLTLSLCSMNSARLSRVCVTSAMSWEVRANSMLRMSSSCWSSLSSDQQDRKAALNRSLRAKQTSFKTMTQSVIQHWIGTFFQEQDFRCDHRAFIVFFSDNLLHIYRRSHIWKLVANDISLVLLVTEHFHMQQLSNSSWYFTTLHNAVRSNS